MKIKVERQVRGDSRIRIILDDGTTEPNVIIASSLAIEVNDGFNGTIWLEPWQLERYYRIVNDLSHILPFIMDPKKINNGD